ncbi:hypothetical protein EVG20_g8174 [Dentipellis fragilis]|uniref:Cytochrome P450 n=1 Tax=Dentipellis fragilis TaxID=205917 RepID=A0A4Y9Y8J9_9AGAM|nr:hypothetical protein EVG20_g8174 [Dentipellis fragilis]
MLRFYAYLDFLALGVSVAVIFWLRNLRRRSGVPPGPPGRGLLSDNRAELQASGKPRWVVFDRWAKQYGPIFSVRLGLRTEIVITDTQVAWDLLEKRGDIYSSRPRNIVGGEILSKNFRGVFAPYGDRWRKFRKVLNIGLSGKQALTYRQFQALESCLLLEDILQDPASFTHSMERYSMSTAFAVSYGSRIRTAEDRIVKEHDESFAALAQAVIPGRYIVEHIPALLYLPKCLQWFRWEAEARHEIDVRLLSSYLHQVRDKMDQGSVKECLSSRILSMKLPAGYTEAGVAYAAAAPYTAGVDTTSATLHVFMLAMLHYPDVMKKAQAELDSVVGRERLPTFEDEDFLPYCGALIKEVTRWRPIGPLGVAHAVTRDDYYNGYYIPAGSTVWGCIYSMAKDERIFPQAEKFRPERFLETTDPRLVDFTLPFGFGRRFCPGMHVALQSVYIIIVRILWAFDVVPAVDAAGQPVLPDSEAFVQKSIVRQPAPFKFLLTPRGPEVAKMVEMEASEAKEMLKEWE